MSSLLTLDPTTLFYWTLSDSYLEKKRKHSLPVVIDSEIDNWAASIPRDAGPTSLAPSRVTTTSSGRPKSTAPSLTNRSSHSSAPSVLTDNIRVVSRGVQGSAKSKAGLPEISVFSDGGLSDADEITGEEREAAVKSPPKGKTRVSNDVSFFCSYCLTTYVISNLATCSSKDRQRGRCSKRGASRLDRWSVVPPHICHHIYGLRRSNR
jgi:hypothetical protein